MFTDEHQKHIMYNPQGFSDRQFKLLLHAICLSSTIYWIKRVPIYSINKSKYGLLLTVLFRVQSSYTLCPICEQNTKIHQGETPSNDSNSTANKMMGHQEIKQLKNKNRVAHFRYDKRKHVEPLHEEVTVNVSIMISMEQRQKHKEENLFHQSSQSFAVAKSFFGQYLPNQKQIMKKK